MGGDRDVLCGDGAGMGLIFTTVSLFIANSYVRNLLYHCHRFELFIVTAVN